MLGGRLVVRGRAVAAPAAADGALAGTGDVPAGGGSFAPARADSSRQAAVVGTQARILSFPRNDLLEDSGRLLTAPMKRA